MVFLHVSAVLALGAFVAAQESSTDYQNPKLAKVLLYTYTDGFRHDSIPTAIQQLQVWAPYYNISFDATEDQTKFRTDNLAQYDALLFVHSSGNIFDTQGQTAFADYLAKGGNYAAIHAASAAYLEKPWAPWTQSLGATFDHHPARQTATFVKETTGHPATNPTPDRWTFDEEVYSFTTDPRKLGAKLLFSVDESTYKENNVVAAQGKPHPIGKPSSTFDDISNILFSQSSVVPRLRCRRRHQNRWSRPRRPGRSFYSSLGHNNSTWMDSTFMKHVMGGLTWTLASNTTRVASGLYGGAEPTVHTGASSNVTSAAVAAWAPVLGSDQTAPPPPPPKTTPTSSAGPESTSGANTSSSSSSAGVRPGMQLGAWGVVAGALGAVFALSL
ncbi:Class I glutamine amidotransferase-like protein [Rhizoctonia solani]|uniref:Class I glutamine amidotransferase-like protein n=1 Tax=Rhizoctonia solani TaxID=456999 RepID=A0A8H7M175_9AGAM|nr:Class I glutamine amidotransferase-like protein [Rhizoctonia solani]